MNEQEMKRQFLASLPWYVNGTLDADGRKWVDQYLRDHPEAASELRWEESQRDVIRENQPVVSRDIGWDAFQARIGKSPRVASIDWKVRWRRWFADFQQGRTWTQRPAAVYATLAIIMVQAGVVGTLVFEQGKLGMNAAVYRGWVPPTTTRPVLRVRFKPETPERKLRVLLIGLDGTIRAGPSQLGDYIVGVDPDQLNEAAKTLAASAWVEAVDILPNPPNIDSQ
jgi:hypothetical protein